MRALAMPAWTIPHLGLMADSWRSPATEPGAPPPRAAAGTPTNRVHTVRSYLSFRALTHIPVCTLAKYTTHTTPHTTAQTRQHARTHATGCDGRTSTSTRSSAAKNITVQTSMHITIDDVESMTSYHPRSLRLRYAGWEAGIRAALQTIPRHGPRARARAAVWDSATGEVHQEFGRRPAVDRVLVRRRTQ